MDGRGHSRSQQLVETETQTNAEDVVAVVEAAVQVAPPTVDAVLDPMSVPRRNVSINVAGSVWANRLPGSLSIGQVVQAVTQRVGASTSPPPGSAAYVRRVVVIIRNSARAAALKRSLTIEHMHTHMNDTDENPVLFWKNHQSFPNLSMKPEHSGQKLLVHICIQCASRSHLSSAGLLLNVKRSSMAPYRANVQYYPQQTNFFHRTCH